ncbi:hypothetical protein V3C99_003097 [Haemonchus contortus]
MEFMQSWQACNNRHRQSLLGEHYVPIVREQLMHRKRNYQRKSTTSSGNNAAIPWMVLQLRSDALCTRLRPRRPKLHSAAAHDGVCRKTDHNTKPRHHNCRLLHGDSALTSLRCPYLKEIVSCQPGRPALQIVNNPHLTIVEIPTTTVVPVNEKVIIIDRNAQLSPVIIKQLRLICPLCDIQNDYSTCSELDVIGDVELFVKKCAGQPIITFKTGVEQQLILTEEQITRLFENAVEVQMCLAVKMSSIQQLVFPKLMQWRSCARGKNALAVVNNPQLEILSFPACTNPRCIENIVVEGNPYLPTEQINVIHGFCINCHLEYYAPACGLGNRTFTPQQLVRACAGKHVIVPPANSPGIIIYSKDVTEVELNRFCSNAVYMQACIVMEGSPFTSLQCPYLEKIVPCQPGRAVFEITGNNALSEVVISKTVIFPEGEKVVTVTGNPLLSPSTITQLKGICPYCDISDVYSKCRWVQTFGSVEEIVEECAGQPIIMGGLELTL